MDYKGDIADAIAQVKAAVTVYEDLPHPYLIRLVDNYPVGDGHAAILDWVDGEEWRRMAKDGEGWRRIV